jgi:saccharopine dehydrogenase (NAD+, L-lysine-forming)
MPIKTFLILGGYGAAGLPTARLLLEHTQARVIVAGRNRQKAQETAVMLNAQFPGARARALRVDAADPESLAAAFAQCDMVVICSTTVHCAQQIARAALFAGIDYLDIYYSPKAALALNALRPAIESAGRCFITQAGCHPGLPAALVRYAAPRFSRLRRAMVAMAVSTRIIGSTASVRELLEDITDYKAEVFRGGQWRKAGYGDAIKIDFGSKFGARLCYPMQLEEMRALPERLGLEELGLYAAGFNWFVDYIVFPLTMLLAKARSRFIMRFLARMFIWGMSAFSRPPFGITFKLEAEGEKDGRHQSLHVTVCHQDGYMLTAIPTAACLLQYLDGFIARPGLWLMAHAVDPGRLLADMHRMGATIHLWPTGTAP